MRLLLDTHVWLWWRSEPNRLNRRVLKLLKSETSEVFFSAASAWELSIKISRGRLKLKEGLDRFLAFRLAEDRFEELEVTLQHAVMTAALPVLHRDPFDRMLLAQARCENLTLVTGDEAILQYGENVMDARQRR